MAGPFEIVRVAAEDADITRRSINDANVLDLLGLEKVVEIAAVHHLNADCRAGRSLSLFRGLKSVDILLDRGGKGVTAQSVGPGLYLCRDVFTALGNKDRVALGRYLTRASVGLKSGFDKVLFRGRGRHQSVKAAMMVCQNEAFGRYKLGGAADTQPDDRVRQAAAGRIINIGRLDLQAELFERELGDLIRHEHPFIKRKCRRH